MATGCPSDAERGPPDHPCVVEATGCALRRAATKLRLSMAARSRVAPDEVAPYPVSTTALIDGGSIMLVIVQIVGALLVLVPFVAQQFGKLNADASAYLWPNAVGSAALAVSRQDQVLYSCSVADPIAPSPASETQKRSFAGGAFPHKTGVDAPRALAPALEESVDAESPRMGWAGRVCGVYGSGSP
jgi:hypothetical protein